MLRIKSFIEDPHTKKDPLDCVVTSEAFEALLGHAIMLQMVEMPEIHLEEVLPSCTILRHCKVPPYPAIFCG